MARTAAIGIRVEPDLKNLAEQAARADRRTVASLLEKALVEYLERHGYLPAVSNTFPDPSSRRDPELG